MKYVTYLPVLAILAALSLEGMHYREASFLEQIDESPRKLAFSSLITSAPETSEDFNTPIDELTIVENVQPCSTHNSPATTPMKAFYSHAVHNFKTMVQKRLFQEMATEKEAPMSIPLADVPATPAPAVSSNQPVTPMVVIPLTQSKRTKKSNPYNGALMVMTVTPDYFTGAQPGKRIRKKTNKVLTLPAEPQNNINLNHPPAPALELPPKQLVQVKGQLRTKKPEHSSMAQFSLMGPKKRKSRLSLKNCESLKKVETQSK